MAQNRKPLLEVKSGGEPETVAIDGETYDLTDYDSFNVVDQHRLQALARSMQKISSLDELTENDAEKLQSAVDEIFDSVSGDIPGEVREKLRFGARTRIIKHYFLAFGAGAEESEDETLPASKDGQAGTSPGSKDSTEEAPATG